MVEEMMVAPSVLWSQWRDAKFYPHKYNLMKHTGGWWDCAQNNLPVLEVQVITGLKEWNTIKIYK